MTYETILVETKGRVGIIRLNRPDALNALNAKLIAELSAVVDTFETDNAIGCLIITGSADQVSHRQPLKLSFSLIQENLQLPSAAATHQ